MKLAKDLAVHYLYHYLKAEQALMVALRVGSGLPTVQRSGIEAFPLVLPALTIQTAIARYLNAVRQEINLSGQSLAALKPQNVA